MANRLINILDKLLDTLIVIVCILLLFIGVWSVLDNLWLYQSAGDRSILVYRPPKDEILTAERRISENQVAWPSLDDTDSDYPLMQGKDNYEFLNKDPYGEFSLSGSIFLDSNNDPDLGDEYSLIYGHHMAHGAMFGALDAFQDRAYFDAHRTGTITTKTSVFDFETFAVCSADATNYTLFDPRGRTSWEILAFLKGNAMHYTDPPEGERIVALSTCSGDTSVARLLVIGTIREHGEVR